MPRLCVPGRNRGRLQRVRKHRHRMTLEEGIDRMSGLFARNTWTQVAAGFLAITYGFGAPLTAYVEYSDHVLSDRFGYAPAFIYLTCVVQLVCAAGILVRPLASWAAAVLTVITLGAIVSHFRIGSPQTSVGAIVYTAVQIWYGLAMRRPKTVRDADG